MTKAMHIKIATALLFATHTLEASELTTGAGTSTTHIQAVYSAPLDQDAPRPLQGHTKQLQHAESHCHPPKDPSAPEKQVRTDGKLSSFPTRPDQDAPRWFQD